MTRQIAVYLGTGNETTAFGESGRVVVYQKHRETWFIVKEMAFETDKAAGLGQLRRGIRGLVDFLDGTRVLIAGAITGIPYYELEKAGFSLWELSGRPEEFLEPVLAREEEQQLQEANPAGAGTVPVPVEISDGRYHISLKEIQANNAVFTSKQVLLPFLRQGRFYELTVICSHVPPWLETEIISGKLTGLTERIGKNEIKVTIFKKTCCEEADRHNDY